jgi:hypothetical protein
MQRRPVLRKSGSRDAYRKPPITFDPETECYGFRVWMLGKRPHYHMLNVFATKKDTLGWIDPQREREREEADGSDGTVAMSPGYKAGSVQTRV